MKLKAPTGQVTDRTVLKGGIITFVSDGFDAAVAAFGPDRIAQVLENIEGCLVGTDNLRAELLDEHGRCGLLERRMLGLSCMRVRPLVVYNWLQLRCLLRPTVVDPVTGAETARGRPPSLAEVKRLLQPIPDAIAKDVRYIKSDKVDNMYARAATDTAGVRTSSDADDADDAEAAGEPPPARADAAGEPPPARADAAGEPPAQAVRPEGMIHIDNCGLMAATHGSGEELRPLFEGIEGMMYESAGPDGAAPPAAGEGEAAAEPPSMPLSPPPSPGAEPPAAPSIKVRREATAINDYERLLTILEGTFWDLFMFPRPPGAFSTESKKQLRRLVLFYDNRFAHDLQLLYLLADTQRRHATAQAVALTVKTKTGAFASFAKLVADPSFPALLAAAIKDPSSEQAMKVCKLVLPLINMAGSTVPGSNFERKKVLTELYALFRTKGGATLFMTAAIDDVHDRSGIRLMFRSADNSTWPATAHAPECTAADIVTALSGMGGGTAEERAAHRSRVEGCLTTHLDTTIKFDERALQALADANPVATALAFKAAVRALFEDLLGVPASRNVKKTSDLKDRQAGVMGLLTGFVYVVEVNGRKAQHVHAALTGAGMPALITAVAERGDVYLRDVLSRALETQLTAEARPAAHAAEALRQTMFVPKARWPLLSQEIKTASEEFRERAEAAACVCNTHAHTFSCKKGKLGSIGCRFCFPKGHPVPATGMRVLLPWDTAIKCGVADPAGAAAKAEDGDPGLCADSDEDSDGEDDGPQALDWRCVHCHGAEGAEGTREKDVARDMGFAVLPPGAVDAPGAAIALELKRRHLDDVEDVPGVVRELFALGSQGVQELGDEELRRLGKDAHEQIVAPMVRAGLMRPELDEKLGAVRVKEGCRLLRQSLMALAALRCKNADFVEYNRAITFCLGCNTAPMLMGSGLASRAMTHYLVKYVTKDAVDLSASMSVLADAMRHVEARPSTAADTGSVQRTAKHFMQRVCHKSFEELSPTQAASLVLGMPAHESSENFTFAYHWDAVQLLVGPRDEALEDELAEREETEEQDREMQGDGEEQEEQDPAEAGQPARPAVAADGRSGAQRDHSGAAAEQGAPRAR